MAKRPTQLGFSPLDSELLTRAQQNQVPLGIEFQPTGLAHEPQHAGDGDASGSQRVGHLLVGQAHCETYSPGGGFPKFLAQQFQKVLEAVFDPSLPHQCQKGFRLTMAKGQGAEQLPSQFGRSLDFSGGQSQQIDRGECTGFVGGHPGERQPKGHTGAKQTQHCLVAAGVTGAKGDKSSSHNPEFLVAQGDA